MDNTELRIQTATHAEIPLLLTFIKELASYEKLLENVGVTEERLRKTLFGEKPRGHAIIAYYGESPVAFSIYFFNLSTFDGRPGLYVEDIFVRPAFRGSGVGRKLFEYLSARAREEGCSRIELSVLNWNEDAIQFYKKLGGEPVNGWTVIRFSEKAIDDLDERLGLI